MIAVEATECGTGLKEGMGTCCGSFGELLYGVLSGDIPFLVNLKIRNRSCVRLRLRSPAYSPLKEMNFARSYERFAKSYKVIRHILTDFGIHSDPYLEIESDLPVGAGLGSSEADMVASIRALGAALSIAVKPDYVSRVLREIEPHNGVHYAGTAVYEPVSGKLLAQYDSVPAINILGLECPPPTDVFAPDLPPDAFTEADRVRYRELLEDVKEALAAKDIARVGRISTEGVRMRHRIRPREDFELALDLMRRTGAVGVVAAHTGSSLGLMYEKDRPDTQAIEAMVRPSLGAARIRWFETVDADSSDEGEIMWPGTRPAPAMSHRPPVRVFLKEAVVGRPAAAWSTKYSLKCAACGWSHVEDAYYIGCPDCGGLLEVALNEIPKNPIDRRYTSIFKYHPVMPYDPSIEAILGFENIDDTPVVFAEALSNRLDIELHFKDETVMPSGTWKDREGFVSLYRLLRSGVTDLVVFSSGNSATSLARSATAVNGPRLHFVIPLASRRRLETYPQFFSSDRVNVTLFEGSNDECIDQARRLAAELGYQIEGGFTNYARREGLKLLALEVILGWGRKIDWYVQAVAGGIGVYGFFKAHQDLGLADQCPKILGVQPAICAPMVNAWKAGASALDEEWVPQKIIPSKYVRVLRTRRPADSYPVLKNIMDRIGGRFESASDEQIHEALRMFYLDPYYREVWRNEKRLVGLEPATALAGIVKGVAEGYIRRGERVLLNVSGAAKIGDVDLAWISDLL